MATQQDIYPFLLNPSIEQLKATPLLVTVHQERDETRFSILRQTRCMTFLTGVKLGMSPR